MNRLIESIKDAPHDALIVAGMFSIPVLIALWIVNRMRQPGARLTTRACYRQRGIRACAMRI